MLIFVMILLAINVGLILWCCVVNRYAVTSYHWFRAVAANLIEDPKWKAAGVSIDKRSAAICQHVATVTAIRFVFTCISSGIAIVVALFVINGIAIDNIKWVLSISTAIAIVLNIHNLIAYFTIRNDVDTTLVLIQTKLHQSK